VVRYVNKVLVDAIKAEASDIHFEPYEKYFRIRFRQDGMLREVANPPLNISGRLVARLKVMSRMNIAERRVPQDGRIKLKLSRTATSTSASIPADALRREGRAAYPRLQRGQGRHRQLGMDPSRKKTSWSASRSPTA
jgi:type II secretory ATPase GspE/PulE/Tfp pilus assembly ATPase PilB-like protein